MKTDAMPNQSQSKATATRTTMLCPGQGAQAVGMGSRWYETSAAARKIFDHADQVLGDSLGRPLTELCFTGTPEEINRTNVGQPAIYVCSIACYEGLVERDGTFDVTDAAGLSLGEYTALYLAGVFDFDAGLQLVATRGRLMQEAAEATESGMVALIGADESQAQSICLNAAGRETLVCANFNAPGQIVVSGGKGACQRAIGLTENLGLRATQLPVAGAFHSPLMKPAADRMADALEKTSFQAPEFNVWSNVTAAPHHPKDMDLLKQRLVEQIIQPVRWLQTCTALTSMDGELNCHELAPGSVLRGLMRRIDKSVKVISHDEP